MKKKTVGFSLIELMVVVTIIGLLASIAIPSFVKHIYKAKTVEAYESLDKIAKAARLYYHRVITSNTTGADSTGQFPTQIIPTPASPAVCCAMGSNKCMTPIEDWNTNNWRFLYFAVHEAHYYSYSFAAAGTHLASIYTAQAQGDLDCDGVFSTFEMRGSVDSEGSVVTFGPMMTRELE